MRTNVVATRVARDRQAGFTLIEALIAMIILIVGLIGIANLFVVAMSSNQIGNYTTVTTATATDVMEKLKAVPFMKLVTYSGPFTPAPTSVPPAAPPKNPLNHPWSPDEWEDGDFQTDVTTSPPPDCVTNIETKDSCVSKIPGVGTVVTHWKIINPGAGGTETRYILVQSEVLALLGRSTRAQFSTFRVCISSGCP